MRDGKLEQRGSHTPEPEAAETKPRNFARNPLSYPVLLASQGPRSKA